MSRSYRYILFLLCDCRFFIDGSENVYIKFDKCRVFYYYRTDCSFFCKNYAYVKRGFICLFFIIIFKDRRLFQMIDRQIQINILIKPFYIYNVGFIIYQLTIFISYCLTYFFIYEAFLRSKHKKYINKIIIFYLFFLSFFIKLRFNLSLNIY